MSKHEVQVPGDKSSAVPAIEGKDQPYTPAAVPDRLLAADSDNEALRRRLDAQDAQIKEMLASMAEMAKGNLGQKVVFDPVSALPDASSVNLKSIKAPVLTKQGWIVPELAFHNPAAARL
jgi:hypothetical protein